MGKQAWAGGEVELVMQPNNGASQLLRGLELEWSLIVVLSWAKMSGPSLNVGCPGKGV